MEKVGCAPTHLDFQSNASTKLASSPSCEINVARNRTLLNLQPFYRCFSSAIYNCSLSSIYFTPQR